MLSQETRRSCGFTLIELLTVIAIIGILAAILIPVASSVRDSANRARTKSQFSSWTNAMVLFKQEYGYFPNIDNNNERIVSSDFAAALTGRALNGSVIADQNSLKGNRKKLSFYSIADNDLNETKDRLVDAFGNTDIVVLYDRDGDGMIRGGFASAASPEGDTGPWAVTPAAGGDPLSPLPVLSDEFPIRAQVVFYSAGKGRSASDIVYSWK